MSIYFARLYPYSPREGYRVQSITTRGIAFKGGSRPPWYRITEEQKAELEQKRQNPFDRHSKPLFQFANENQKSFIEEQERTQLIAAQMLQRGAIIDPEAIPRSRIIDLTGGITDEGPITGGRADAIPPARDIRPSVTETASYEDDNDFDEELQESKPAFIAPKPAATPPLALPPAKTEVKPLMRGRPKKSVPPQVAPSMLPKPLGGSISASDLKGSD